MRILDFDDGFESEVDPTEELLPAKNVTFEPAGEMASTNVQDALVEQHNNLNQAAEDLQNNINQIAENQGNHEEDFDNPHLVTHVQVGSGIPQWNADRIQGKDIAAPTELEDGKAIIFNHAEDKFEYGNAGGNYESIPLLDGDIDWSLGNIFYLTLSANETLSFANDDDGKTITALVENDSGNEITLSFPSNIYWSGGEEVSAVQAGMVNAYTFIKGGGSVFVATVPDLEVPL